MAFLRSLFVSFFLLLQPSSAHVVEQIYADWVESEEGWKLVVQFDAGYADPDTRDDAFAPAPTREWLLVQGEAEWQEMREEAERYLRELLVIEVNGQPVDWMVDFPDWAASPPNFPRLLNGGGYFRMNLSLSNPLPGRVDLAVREGDWPKFVVASDGEFLVLAPGASKQGVREGGGAGVWLREGYRHVIPLGWDHVLFVIGLFCYRRRFWDLLHQSLAFTVAHSLTLGLAAGGLIAIPVGWSGGLEVLIAASLILVGIENLRAERRLPTRLLLVFALGLLHGLGFAGALANFVDRDQLLASVGMLNLGVELAQVTLLLIAWLVTTGWSEKPAYEKVRQTGSLLVAAAGLWWVLSRSLSLMG